MIFVAYFFSSIFFVNGIPHFVQGVSGNSFQSPFASPPGIGKSSPVVNVLWGAFNLFIACALFSYAGFFDLGFNMPSFSFVAGGLSVALILAFHFGKVRRVE